MHSVKSFFWVVSLALAMLFATTPSVANEHVWEVADGVYRYGPGNGYYSMFVVTDDGVIAIEPINTAHSQGFLNAIESVTDQPVKYLLHSHNHWDHSGGGQVFRDVGVKIVAHKDAQEWMEANPHPDMVIPDDVWEGNRRDIALGGKTVELHHFGISHGLGMTVFLLPDEQVIYIADLVTPERVIFAIAPDFNIREWVRTLEEIEKLEFQTAIYSHTHSGEPTGSKLEVTQTREYIEDLRAAIVAEFGKGTSFTQIPNAVKLPKYEQWAMYDEWLPLNVWRVMLEMHMGPFPWQPGTSSAN